ncbi:MAG: ABC transporter substrate-binding protein [Fimbriimonadaceae bacterium]|nr:ABC transporter substrate-binding protein [Fimbriimonadaceae bacterium]
MQSATARRGGWWLTVGLVVGLTGCAKPPADPSPTPSGETAASSATAPDGAAIQFWHTQTKENEAALKEIIAAFNAAHPGQPAIQPTLIGNYTQLYEKIRAAAQSKSPGSLPDLLVAYESMIADYMEAAIVRPLDDLLKDPQVGLDADSLADIWPSYLETNRFRQFNNQLLSFPFTKSNLCLFYNADLLAKAGVKVPQTWEQFLQACRQIKAQAKLTPLATFPDASTIDGLILSFGGSLVSADGKDAILDDEATKVAFAMLQTLRREKLAYTVTDKDGQNADFAAQKCAFFFRSSASRPFLTRQIAGKFKWGASGLPVKAGAKPVTVMFGANIAILKSSPEREKIAWEFVKYFSTTAVTAKWAQATGYLPVRKSAAADAGYQQFLAANPQAQQILDLLPVAVPEPNVAGWQGVRKCLESAETAVATQVKPADAAVSELNGCADAQLQEAAQP